MLRGAGSYYTPISTDGQVVEKHVDSIQVSREETSPRIVVSYTLTNPYDHPVVVPIQSGLTLLYEYQDREADGDGDGNEEESSERKPELHVVPATVTRHEDDEVLYVADEPSAVFGTTAIQRQHLGTGIPNYRHPVAISITLVPGDSIELQATAHLPPQVARMILVDTMVGPEQPYGLYPQLLEHPSSEGRIPPPLRVYKGASFQTDPPYVKLPANDEPAQRQKPLPRWLNPRRFARLQEVLRHSGRMWSYAVTIGAVLLSASLVLRLVLAGLPERITVDAVRTVAFALLGAGTVAGSRTSRIMFVLALAASGLVGLVRVVVAVTAGSLEASILLTGATSIPILYLVGAAILLVSPAVRAHTTKQWAPHGRAGKRHHDE